MSCYCSNCGAECTPNSKFCQLCGEPVKILDKPENQEEKLQDTDAEVNALEEKNSYYTPNNAYTFLILALLSFSVLPSVLEALAMFIAKQAISVFVLFICELFGTVLGLYFISKYLCKVVDYPGKRDGIIKALNGALWMYLTIIAVTIAVNQLEIFALKYLFNAYWISFVILFIIIAIGFIATYSLLYRTLTKLSVKGFENNKNIRSFFTKQKAFWKSLLLALAIGLIPEIIDIIISILPIDIPLSFVNTLGLKTLTLLLQALLIIQIVKDIVKIIDPQPTEKVEDSTLNTTGINFKAIPSFLVAGIILLAIFGYELVSPMFNSPIEAMKTGIKDDVHYGSIYLAAGDIEMAMKMYDSAYDRTQAWIAFAGNSNEDKNRLVSLYKSNPQNEEIEYLTAIKTYSTNELEKTIIDSKSSTDWYLTLLNSYKEQEKSKDNPNPLTEKQKLIRRDLINICIAAEHFVNNSFTFNSIKGKEGKIIDAMKPYMDFVEYYGSYKVLLDISKKGGINNDIMNRLLNYAEDNPMNILAQYMAYAAGTGFLYDGAPHYKRTAEAAIRFGRLYMEQIGDNGSSSHIISVNLEVANALMEVLDYRNAIAFLDIAMKHGAGSETRLISATCYDALEDYEMCKEMALEVLEDDPSNNQALYLAMMGALKTGNITESMVFAGQLLELLPSLNGGVFLEVDAQIYSYIQYFTIEPKTNVYPNLNEEQQKILDQSELFENYTKALYFTFGRNDQNQALDYALKTWEKLQNSPQMNYLVGTIYYNRKEFSEAAEYYKASLAIDDNVPNIWYNLAITYDALGNYQEAYNCSLKVDSMLKYCDHDVDRYGVQIHNKNLLDKLASIVK